MSDLIEEPVKKRSKKKDAAAAQEQSINMQMFHREVNHLLQPELLIFPANGDLEFDGVSENLAAVVKELGPCYQRFLTAETYNGRQLSEDF